MTTHAQFLLTLEPAMSVYSSYTDPHLLQLLTDDDKDAFEQIYDRYWKVLYSYAYTILQLEEVAQDAVQEVFVSLWERRKIAKIQLLEVYLKGAIRFQVLSAIRAQKTNKDFYLRYSLHVKDLFTENPLLSKEMEALLHQIIQALPEDQQEIFQLSREQGLTYAQIAEMKGISVKTVEKKMTLSLKHIRSNLGDSAKIMLLLFPQIFK